jgi:benzoate 4-monooxygenase
VSAFLTSDDVILSWLCVINYYLARYPDMQEKLQKELDEALGASGDAVTTFEQAKRLTWMPSLTKPCGSTPPLRLAILVWLLKVA